MYVSCPEGKARQVEACGREGTVQEWKPCLCGCFLGSLCAGLSFNTRDHEMTEMLSLSREASRNSDIKVKHPIVKVSWERALGGFSAEHK